MGLFTKQQTDVAPDARARKRATKMGIDTEGAVFVGVGYADTQQEVLVVHRDRVELHRDGKAGSLFRSGAGAQVIPVDRVSSVGSVKDGMWVKVTVYTSGTDLEFRSNQVTAGEAVLALQAVTA